MSLGKINHINKGLKFNDVYIKPITTKVVKNNISFKRTFKIREHLEWIGEPFFIKNNKKDKFSDMSNSDGYANSYNALISICKEKNINDILIAGYSCTPERTREMITHGADIVKLGTKGCFAGNSKILMADGTIKNICKLEENDFIIDKDGNSVRVNSIEYKGNKDTYVLFNNHFNTETYVTPDHKYYVYDFMERCFKWIELENIINQYHYKLTIPSKINWSLETDYEIILGNNKIMKSGFILGYFTALYLVYNLSKNKILIPKNTFFYQKSMLVLNYIIKHIFLIETNTIYADNFIEIIFENNNILDCINNNIYLCNNHDFIKGMYDVLKDFDTDTLIQKKLTNIYTFCCINMAVDIDGNKLQTIGNHLILDNIDICTDKQKIDVWDISCDTNSFICDYTTVHNSDLFNVPELTMAVECSDVAHQNNKFTMMNVNRETGFKALVAGVDFLEFDNEYELNEFKSKLIDSMYNINSHNLTELYQNSVLMLK